MVYFSGAGLPRLFRKKSRKMDVVVVAYARLVYSSFGFVLKCGTEPDFLVQPTKSQQQYKYLGKIILQIARKIYHNCLKCSATAECIVTDEFHTIILQ